MSKQNNTNQNKKFENWKDKNVKKLSSKVSKLNEKLSKTSSEKKATKIKGKIEVHSSKLEKTNKLTGFNPEDSVKYKSKKWFFGVGKEFSRITWSSKSRVFKNFIVVICIIVFFSIVFLLLDMLIIR